MFMCGVFKCAVFEPHSCVHVTSYWQLVEMTTFWHWSAATKMWSWIFPWLCSEHFKTALWSAPRFVTSLKECCKPPGYKSCDACDRGFIGPRFFVNEGGGEVAVAAWWIFQPLLKSTRQLKKQRSTWQCGAQQKALDKATSWMFMCVVFKNPVMKIRYGIILYYMILYMVLYGIIWYYMVL